MFLSRLLAISTKICAVLSIPVLVSTFASSSENTSLPVSPSNLQPLFITLSDTKIFKNFITWAGGVWQDLPFLWPCEYVTQTQHMWLARAMPHGLELQFCFCPHAMWWLGIGHLIRLLVRHYVLQRSSLIFL